VPESSTSILLFQILDPAPHDIKGERKNSQIKFVGIIIIISVEIKIGDN